MAQKGAQLDKEIICCSICLDLLRDPVTIPCGHSYCMSCIKTQWDGEDKRKIHSCPQCRQTFIPRPVLVKNTMLAVLVEELKNIGPKTAAAADHCYAGSGSVACDVCTGRKLKAVKSCLQCLVSYCEKHLQPHFESAAFGPHKLVDPSEKLRENICSHHAEVMKMFCRTDLQCICYLCSVDDHQGHNIVSSATERAQRQRQLEVSRQTIQHKIWNKVKDVKALQQEAETISRSADEAAEKSEKILTDLIRLMEKRRCDVKQMIRSLQEIEEGRIKELQEELEQEITELRRKDTELEKLSHTEDHNQFLRNYSSLSKRSEPVDSSSICVRPVHYFEDVTAAVSELRDKLQHILSEDWTNICLTDGLPSNTGDEPKTRADFLKYSHELTMDPNTANVELSLSNGNRRATHMRQKQKYPEHADRFTICGQVLSRESLIGRCYWEVECSVYGVYVAVAYKNISRKGTCDKCIFGYNDKSWALDWSKPSYTFWHNNIRLPVSGPCSSRIGVYLDHTAGILSFYSISETMTLLHRVQTMFTQPLYAGLWFTGGTAEFCKLK